MDGQNGMSSSRLINNKNRNCSRASNGIEDEAGMDTMKMK